MAAAERHRKSLDMVNGPLHPADLVAALTKRGTSLRALARSSGVSVAGLSYALRFPAERAERIIAQELDTTPAVLWPERFTSAGERRGRSPRRARKVAA